jgi:hypothetical protein
MMKSFVLGVSRQNQWDELVDKVRVLETPKSITITRRSSDFHACATGRPEIWGCGAMKDDAICSMIRCHVDRFNIKIEEW